MTHTPCQPWARGTTRRVWLWVCAALVGCAQVPPPVAAPPLGPSWAALRRTPVLILGEQHDADQHQAWQTQVVRHLGLQRDLAALVLEMADAGRNTRGLATSTDEATTRAALDWDDRAWPWQRYGPTVMAAVRAGVVVWGGNLPRSAMAAAMGDTAIDDWLGADTWAHHLRTIDLAHCGLMPAAQLPRMARVQLARDRQMAQAVLQAWRPQQVVVLVTGNEHARRQTGVPRHLALLPQPWPGTAGPVRVVHMQTGTNEALQGTLGDTDTVWTSPALPAQDHCARLRPNPTPPAPR